MEWLIGLGGAAIALGSFLLGLSRHSRESKREVAQDAAQNAADDAGLKKDVEYIKKGIDAIQLNLKEHGDKMDKLTERIVKVEMKADEAIRRIELLEKGRAS